MINTHFTISGISIQIVGHQPQGITMHEKAVALRIVDGNGTPGGNGITRQFVVEAIITGKLFLCLPYHSSASLSKASPYPSLRS